MAYHPTPDLPHFSSFKFDVYEPAEDSFLLMDALHKDLDFLMRMKPLICVEIGSGSGAVITFLATLLDTTPFHIAVDINSTACCCASRTLQCNGIRRCDSVCDDLVRCLQSRLSGEIDVLLFNPPYVVTPSEEVTSNGIAAAWAGGKDGREVTDQLLPSVSSLLSPKGALYLVAVEENKPAEIMKQMEAQGLESQIALSRRAQNEKLVVLKFTFHHYNT